MYAHLMQQLRAQSCPDVEQFADVDAWAIALRRAARVDAIVGQVVSLTTEFQRTDDDTAKVWIVAAFYQAGRPPRLMLLRQACGQTVLTNGTDLTQADRVRDEVMRACGQAGHLTLCDGVFSG